jgi:hypothetical protein
MSDTGITPTVGSTTLAGVRANAPAPGILYIGEFDSVLGHQRSGTDWTHFPTVQDQLVAFGPAVNISRPFTQDTRLVRLHATAACLIRVDMSPTAAPLMRMGANATETFACSPGASVLVIASA